MVAADSKAKFLQDAEKFVLHGKVQQAIGEYLKIVKIDPNDVLILNTIGDLYLRQKNVPEANKYFSRVAENYVRNNFFLKAIAVYKKILSADPDNLEINLTMASLYARQGLTVDARSQYLKITALLEREGKASEVAGIYEKIVELDPSNAAIHRKLAELQLEAGNDASAHTHWIAASRAQMKAGDTAGAMDSIRRALDLSPLDANAIGGLLECCRKTGDLGPAIDQLKESIQHAPQNLDIRDMLGQAYLAAGDLDLAAKAFHMAFSMDESRYEGLFAVVQAWIARDDCDRAAECLDPVISVLITRRETERAVELFGQILQRRPKHGAALARLASIHSATGDRARHLETLDRLADQCMEEGNASAALECLETILQANPDSQKHRSLHRRAFADVHPNAPYKAPEIPRESIDPQVPAAPVPGLEPGPGASAPEIVEADLLLNYGLKDKALKLLQGLEVRDPANKDMRVRLMHLYKAENRAADAARQCLLLAALSRLEKNEAAVQDYLAEARQISPDAGAYEQDLEEFARRNGITAESAGGTAPDAASLRSDGEVDLSADLMDIFFTGDQDAALGEESGMEDIPEVPLDVSVEAYPQEIQQPPARSVQEQLQEVDFYIRLGFHDEARAKLNEIAKIDPDNAELASRYRRLDEPAQDSGAGSADRPVPAVSEAAGEYRLPREADAFRGWEAGEAAGGFAILDPGSDNAGPAREPLPEDSVPSAAAFEAWNDAGGAAVPDLPPETETAAFQATEMFADLMDDIGGSEAQEVSMESFENHFSLGTAYREMDLMEEAIQEFQNALRAAGAHKNAAKTIQCCGMLSTCYLKKRMPRSALRWCQAGLRIADNSSHEAMALRYDMGVAHAMSGSSEQALECFEHIFNLDPDYRDVARQIDELKSGPGRYAR